ncbi:MAG: protein arginine kinase [Phycisphaerales bacterium]|nr:protein arginine kinase [Phycisphaerales bacterium]
MGGGGPACDVVISSRVRLARNIAGYPFVAKASTQQRQEIVALVARCAPKWADGMVWVDLSAAPSLDRTLLVERRLISRNHAKGSKPRGVAFTRDESVSVMVNEEDHLRIQVLQPGLQLHETYERIDRVDDEVESEIDYSFSNRFGYLTACPTNVGTGIRVSVMLHLPALRLRGEIEKVRRAVKDMQLALRGFHGEGTEATGDFYQLSNQTTLGRSEREILGDFVDGVIPSVVEYEHRAREALLAKRRVFLEDQVFRAWGLLTSARLLDADETLQLLSLIRLGSCLGLIESVDPIAVRSLLLLTQPAHLQRIVGKRLDQAGRRIARAELVRERLAGNP